MLLTVHQSRLSCSICSCWVHSSKDQPALESFKFSPLILLTVPYPSYDVGLLFCYGEVVQAIGLNDLLRQ
jgi:hypothetical protein